MNESRVSRSVPSGRAMGHGGRPGGTTKRLAGAILVCTAALLVMAGTSVAGPGPAPGPAPVPAQGVVKWRFQVSGQYVLHPPAVGPDGGVVVASSTGDVYSLTAAGALRWVRSVGADGGPSIGPDGTAYVASMNTITAIAPDGSIRWTFTEPSSGQGVIAGPTVGPDGNVYVISDFGGLGAFALSPAGQLLWSNSGNPTFAEYGQLGAEIVFGSGRLFAAFDEYGVAPSTMFGLSLGGAQQWARPLGGSDDPFMQQQRQPATGADGSLYLTAMGGANGWSLRRVDPANGNVLWQLSPSPSNGMSPPSVGVDGSVYFSRSLGYLDSVTAAGQPRWTFFDGSIIDHPAVSPDGSVVVAGNRPNFGEPGLVRGWNATTGQLAWQIGLPNEDGGYQIAYTQPRFSADGRTAYFGTAVLGGAGQLSFVYAVETGAGQAGFAITVAKSGNGSGTVTSSPSGINCGSTCSASFDSGTQITLTATPDTNSSFTGWSGSGCSGTGTCQVMMDQTKSVTATFSLSGGTTEVYPSSFTVQTGTALSGTGPSLRADDDNYLVVRSTKTGTRTATWFGTFTGVNNTVSSLAATYKGKASATCTQVISIFRWTDSIWVQLDSRSVGTTEILISSLSPSGTLADFVSNTSGTGDVRIRLSCTNTTSSFNLSGDLLKLVVG